jgi:predicted secreted protein
MRTIALAAAVSALLASAAVAQPDINADPNYGSVNLESGFTPDPYEHAILAGGACSSRRATWT